MTQFFELKFFRKDSLMSDVESDEEGEGTEYVITELIIAEVKLDGELSKMAKAVIKKFEENFGGSWTVFISKIFPGGWAGIPPTGIFIEFEREDCHFVVFKK